MLWNLLSLLAQLDEAASSGASARAHRPIQRRLHARVRQHLLQALVLGGHERISQVAANLDVALMQFYKPLHPSTIHGCGVDAIRHLFQHLFKLHRLAL